jgi:DNA mismatch endonuclease, patch repair protein
MDHLNPEQRSRLMARIRGKDTHPEKRVRKIAHAMGLRFRLHRKDLKGTPDLVFPKHKVSVFVHGCFWHQHPHCKRGTMPATQKDFWSAKLTRNVARDQETISQLKSEGWRVEIIWECETKEPEQIKRRLKSIFFGRRSKVRYGRVA